jgi:hypothetical protein
MYVQIEKSAQIHDQMREFNLFMKRGMSGHRIVPEGNARQREAISVVWSLDTGGEDPWRVPSQDSEHTDIHGFGYWLGEFRQIGQINGRILAMSCLHLLFRVNHWRLICWKRVRGGNQHEVVLTPDL